MSIRQGEKSGSPSADIKKKKNISIILWILIASLALLSVLYTFYMAISDERRPLINPHLTVEAGHSVTPSDFASFLGDRISFVEGEKAVNTSMPGDYPVTLKLWIFRVNAYVTVRDTVPPDAVMKSAVVECKSEVTPYDVIEKIIDETPTTAKFALIPSTEEAGVYEVTVILTDYSGNETRKTSLITVSPVYSKLSVEAGKPFPEKEAFFINNDYSYLDIKTDVSSIDMNVPGEYDILFSGDIGDYISVLSVKDTVAPVITALNDINVEEGDTLFYRQYVSVSDNSGNNITLDIDSSGVDINTPGEYSVTYVARDESGNQSTLILPVVVGKTTVDRMKVNEEAARIISEIITDDMTGREKLSAIYDYVKSHMTYFDPNYKPSLTEGAYTALFEGKGDCFFYASLAKVLLDSAGIENIIIDKLPGYATEHEWNLVNIGEGWYHFDTCPREDVSGFNYVTDEELMKYSKSHNNSHIYDPSLYPDIE
ncbi:MAG: DUF5011 domain-containing protein [Lachnospiraceae bacterium]|nr:DUF5011 domain-containing protein [Lachnospiraceae bacterium]